jgi:hypothetical protein
MSSKEDIRTLANKILESDSFRDSQVYKDLLSFLIDSKLTETVPKEITIAIRIFGKDSNFNSNKDSTVRYHIHILRKKLENYNKNEGKADKHRIIIPKGHYEIQYVSTRIPVLDKVKKLYPFFGRKEILIIVLLLLLNMALVYRLFFARHTGNVIQKNGTASAGDPIWDSFFDNDFPVTIILGDDYLLDEFCPDYNRYRQVRDWEIDSEGDLSNFLLQYPQARLWKSEITLVPFGGTENLMHILPVVYTYRSEALLKMSSFVSLEEIRYHNIIFMGEFKNLRVLEQIIRKTPIRFQYNPDERIFIMGDRGDTSQTFLRIEAPYEQEDKYNIDYSFLIKTHGFSNENFIFVVGFGYGGRLERTRMLGDPGLMSQLVADIIKINKRIPEYFMLLFEVKSIERTGFTNEIKYFKELD